MSNRKLSTQEIGILLHLLRTGSEGQRPVRLLKGAQRRAAPLVLEGLLDIWHRQSIATGRPEGPFYTLTFRGHELAMSLYMNRLDKRRDDLRKRTEIPWTEISGEGAALQQ